MTDKTNIAAWACKGKGLPLEPWSYTAAPLRDTDVHINISHCGICFSDIHTQDSGWGPAAYPVVTGHEIVGIVAAAGTLARFNVGDRVGVGAQCNSCHKCTHCRAGRENVCSKGVFTYNSVHPDGHLTYGGYADAVRVPSEFVFAIPEAISSAEAAPLLCAGTTVFAPLQRHMTPGCRVGVIGIGGLGHLALQFAKALGATEVVAITSSQKKVADLTALGASKILVSSDLAALKEAARSIDVLVCTVNHHELPWELYLSLVQVGGHMVILGVPEESVKLRLSSLIYSQVSLTGSIIGSPIVIEEMLEFCAKHGIRPWIEKSPMSNVNEAIQKVRDNNVRYRYVLEN